MPASGPFRIDGNDFSTDAGGQASRIEPTPTRENIPKRRLENHRVRKIEIRDDIDREITALQAKRALIVTDITNLETLITNARNDP